MDSGVYRSPPDVSALRARAAQSGAAWVDIDLGSVRDKGGLFAVLARALAFPADFGRNWDALNDSLQDSACMPASAYVLHLRNGEAARQALGREWDTLLAVVRESARFWKTRKAFVVIVDASTDLPPWL
jgi:RNAse (barnase) inhibitor barstar